MSESAQQLLCEGLERLGIPSTTDQIGKIQLYLSELKRWNRRYGFLSHRERASERQVIVRHVLDSLSAWKTLSTLGRRDRIADVGSGAGFPGIPLAIFLPDSRFSLVEPSATKSAFLSNIAILGALENVEVLEKRLEQVDTRFDVVMFRAFSPLPRQLEFLMRIAESHGTIIAYKGKRTRIAEELAETDLDPRQVDVRPVSVPFLEEQRHLVVVRRSFSEA